MAMPIAAEVGDKITRQYTEDQAEMGRQRGEKERGEGHCLQPQLTLQRIQFIFSFFLI